MNNKKKIWFFRWDIQQHIYLFLPLVWFEFKRYYELNGRNSDHWEWIEPVMDYSNMTFDNIVEEAITSDADVYMFSSYMWSWDIVKIMALAIREAKPNAIIVLGGPNQRTTYTEPMFWFKDHPYFDATCHPLEYGEYFITDMLDNISEKGEPDWPTVRNSYHRAGRGPYGDKKQFFYPTGMLSSNMDLCKTYSTYATKNNKVLVTLYETNRGCPYSCTYCEWGGGTGTKIRAKAMEDIKDDFSYFKDLNVGSIFITDANFGILPRDVEISHWIAAMKDHIKFVGIMGLAKTSAEKKQAVLEPMFEAGVMQFYQVSLQSIDPEVLKNVERTDIPAEENIKLAKYFIEKYDAETLIELIIGLPGATIPVFYEEMEIEDAVFNKIKPVAHHVPLYVLPDAPVADPKYIEKHKIKLAGINMETMDLIRKNSDSKYVVNFKTKFPKKEYPMYIPVSTSSYTTDDWKEMFLMNDMKIPLINNLLMKPLVDFLHYHKNILPRYSYKKIYNAMIKTEKFYGKINEYLEGIINQTRNDEPWRELKVGPVRGDFSILQAIVWLWVNSRTELFVNLRSEFIDVIDDEVDDLFTYIENSTFRNEAEVTVKWTSKYRWDLYEERTTKSAAPIKESISLKTMYEHVSNWHNYMDLIRNMHTTRVTDGSKIQNKMFDISKLRGNEKT